MNRNPGQPATNAVNGEAINRVLQAEQTAQQAVERCENEAKRILHDARQQAQHIGQRADERIARVEMRCAQWLAEQGRQLAREDSRQAAAGQDAPEPDCGDVVRALAAQLTGAGGESS